MAIGRRANDPFVGRESELSDLRAWFAGGGRLLSLRGPAGIGKSRLAFEFSRELGPAAVVYDRGDGADFGLLLRRLIRQLGGAADAPEETLPAAIAEALNSRGRMLLILDNLDPIGPEVVELAEGLLSAAPRLSILATAREALPAGGEKMLELGPLSLANEAVELLRLRAAAAGADLEREPPAAIQAIAAALDGLPLALELAAAQLPYLPAEQLLERLPARLELLVRAPGMHFSRHNTLLEAIEGSWRLLAPQEQSALAQLSVFRGGFDTAAAEAVLALEGAPAAGMIRMLGDRSLLHERAGRFGLDESVRTFAARMLDPAERLAVERRHAAFYLARAGVWARELDERTDLAAAAALASEQENLLEIHRRALERASVRPDAAKDALEAALVLAPLFLLRPGAGRLALLLDAALGAASPSRTCARLRARALVARGKARLLDGRPASAIADLVEAAGLARSQGDSIVEAWALLGLGRVHREQGRYDESRRDHERAIELLQAAEPGPWLGRALGSRGFLAHDRGELEEARHWYERAVEVHLQCGDRRAGAVIGGTLGNVLFDQGRIAEAIRQISEAIAVFHEIGDHGNEAALLASLASIQQEQGALELARASYDRALDLLRGGAGRRMEALISANRAGLLFEAGLLDEAARCYDEVVGALRSFGDARNLGLTLLPFGMLLAAQGRIAEAVSQLDRAEDLLRGVAEPVHLDVVAAARGACCIARAGELRRAGNEESALAEAARAAASLASAHASKARAIEEGRLVVRLLERALAGCVAEGGANAKSALAHSAAEGEANAKSALAHRAS